MKAEYSINDFKGVMKNPFYEKLITEVVVPVQKDVYQVFVDIAAQMAKNQKKLCVAV